MPIAILKYADGREEERHDIECSAETIVQAEPYNVATAADLGDYGLMGRIRERTFRRAEIRGDRYLFEETALSPVRVVRRNWPPFGG